MKKTRHTYLIHSENFLGFDATFRQAATTPENARKAFKRKLGNRRIRKIELER